MSIFKRKQVWQEIEMTFLQIGERFSQLEREIDKKIQDLKDDLYPIDRHNLGKNPYPIAKKVDDLMCYVDELHDRIRKLEIKNKLH